MPILDPKTHKVSFFKMPVRRSGHAGFARAAGHAGAMQADRAVAPTGATRRSGTPSANNHNAMFDGKGRVWLAATVRGMDNPAWCKKGSEHPSAKVFPIERSRRARSRCSIRRR